MYGLINRAIQEMVLSTYDAATWEDIKASAGIDTPEFLAMEEYPDQMTFALVEAASRRLNASPADLFEAFGQYWVRYTGREDYGYLLRMAGSDLVSFLQNLDLLHARIARSYPALRPPSFECTNLEPGSLLLHYRSDRAGLSPLVVGLVKGLGAMFHTDVRIEQVQEKAKGADHDVFRVEYEPHD